MIPGRIRERDQLAERFLNAALGGLNIDLSRHLGGFLGGSSGLGSLLRIQRTNLQLALVLFQDSFIMIFPELLRSVLPRDALEDLLSTGMFVLEFRQVVDILVDYHPKCTPLALGGDVVCRESLGHVGRVEDRR